MEEKERYEWDAIEGVEWIRDTKIGYLLNRDDMKKFAILLNQQDKQIKELAEENEQLKQKNKKLKWQLHYLPKYIVGEIKKELYSCGKTYLEDEPYIEICIVQGILDTILKKYGRGLKYEKFRNV